MIFDYLHGDMFIEITPGQQTEHMTDRCLWQGWKMVETGKTGDGMVSPNVVIFQVRNVWTK